MKAVRILGQPVKTSNARTPLIIHLYYGIKVCKKEEKSSSRSVNSPRSEIISFCFSFILLNLFARPCIIERENSGLLATASLKVFVSRIHKVQSVKATAFA